MNLSGAEFSPCRTWRYSLWRTWCKEWRMVAFIGLNPSTADDVKDDPTVRRCIRFAQDWLYDGMYMLNIFALRSTDPSALRPHPDPIGFCNDDYLCRHHKYSALTVACWGVHGELFGRGLDVLSMLHRSSPRKPIYCLGTTKYGYPKHPLYQRSDAKLVKLDVPPHRKAN